MLLANEYGPFWSLVGYVGAGVAAITMIILIGFGPMWCRAAPDEDLPKLPQYVVGSLAFIGMVVLWLYAEPSTLWHVVAVAVGMGLLAAVAMVKFAELRGAYIQKVQKFVAGEEHWYEALSGDEYTTEGSAGRADGKPPSKVLSGMGYRMDDVWTQKSRAKIKSRALVLFLCMIIGLALGLSAAGFAVQVKLTNQPAAVMLKKAPGLPPQPVTTQP